MTQIADFFNLTQRRIINRRAKTWFERKEDRDDFRQLVHLLAWENWVERGCPLYDGKPDIYRVDYLVLTARKHLLKGQNGVTESRGGEVLLSEEKLETNWFDRRRSRSLGQMLERCVPANSKDRIGQQMYRFVADNGMRVALSYGELEQFTGFTRNSIGRLRRLNRKVKVYLFEDGKLYPTLKRIQDVHGITEATARWRSKKIDFRWDEETRVV
jgi:hypothetical protein